MNRCLLGALVAATLADALGENCAIAGRTVDALTGQPVVKAKVFVNSSDASDAIPIRHITNDTGEFCFGQLPPGNYTVMAQRAGYLQTSYGAKRADAPGLELTVEQSKALPALTIQMLPQAVLSGVLLDSEGDPIPDGSVSVIRRRWTDGKIGSSEVGVGYTDDHGSFRIGELAAGTYYLRAARKSKNVAIVGNRSFLDANGRADSETETQTYYRAAVSLQKATPISLRTGEELNGLAFTLEKIDARTIRGRVSGDRLKGSFGHVVVMGFDDGFRDFHVAPVAPDGTFQVQGLAPTAYRVTLMVQGPESANLQASKEVDLTDGDQNDLELQPVAPLAFHVVIRVEGGGKPPEEALELYSRSYGYAGKRQPDGSLEFSGVSPGKYQVGLPSDEAFFIKQVLVDGNPLAGDVLDLRSGHANVVTVILSTRVAELSARISDASRLTTEPVFVLERESGQPDSQVRPAGPRGEPVWKSLAPGKYRLFAFEDLDNDLWGSRELAAILASRSVTFQLHEGENRKIEAPLISAKEFQEALRKAGF